MADKKENIEVIAYIVGILSLVFSFISPVAGLVLGIIGFVHAKKEKSPMSMKGKRLSILGIIISVIMIVLVIVLAIIPTLGTLVIPGA